MTEDVAAEVDVLVTSTEETDMENLMETETSSGLDGPLANLIKVLTQNAPEYLGNQ